MRIEWIGIEWIRIGGIRIGGIRVEWICVGYVWCEIRQQSSEEPCDETSFGKKRDGIFQEFRMKIVSFLDDVFLHLVRNFHAQFLGFPAVWCLEGRCDHRTGHSNELIQYAMHGSLSERSEDFKGLRGLWRL